MKARYKQSVDGEQARRYGCLVHQSIMNALLPAKKIKLSEEGG